MSASMAIRITGGLEYFGVYIGDPPISGNDHVKFGVCSFGISGLLLLHQKEVS